MTGIVRIHPALVDVLYKMYWAAPQSGFFIVERVRLKPLRVMPHNTKADAVVAIRGRNAVARRNSGERRGVVPCAPAEHASRAC